MERNDLLGLLIVCGTTIVMTYILNESARIIGWGSV